MTKGHWGESVSQRLEREAMEKEQEMGKFTNSTGRVFTSEMAEAMDAQGAKEAIEREKRRKSLQPILKELKQANEYLRVICGWVAFGGWILILSLVLGALAILFGCGLGALGLGSI